MAHHYTAKVTEFTLNLVTNNEKVILGFKSLNKQPIKNTEVVLNTFAVESGEQHNLRKRRGRKNSHVNRI